MRARADGNERSPELRNKDEDKKLSGESLIANGNGSLFGVRRFLRMGKVFCLILNSSIVFDSLGLITST